MTRMRTQADRDRWRRKYVGTPKPAGPTPAEIWESEKFSCSYGLGRLLSRLPDEDDAPQEFSPEEVAMKRWLMELSLLHRVYFHGRGRPGR